MNCLFSVFDTYSSRQWKASGTYSGMVLFRSSSERQHQQKSVSDGFSKPCMTTRSESVCDDFLGRRGRENKHFTAENWWGEPISVRINCPRETPVFLTKRTFTLSGANLSGITLISQRPLTGGSNHSRLESHSLNTVCVSRLHAPICELTSSGTFLCNKIISVLNSSIFFAHAELTPRHHEEVVALRFWVDAHPLCVRIFPRVFFTTHNPPILSGNSRR